MVIAEFQKHASTHTHGADNSALQGTGMVTRATTVRVKSVPRVKPRQTAPPGKPAYPVSGL